MYNRERPIRASGEIASRVTDWTPCSATTHWLDSLRFYAELRRVAKPDGILVAWGYKMPNVTEEVDSVVQRLDAEVLGQFWLPEKACSGWLSNDSVPVRPDRHTNVSDEP
jgi:hypothetical protein